MRIVFLIGGVLGVIAMGLVVDTFGRLLDARTRLTSGIDPAGFEVRDWFVALVDQETGVRGFALSGAPEFLEPFRDGSISAERSERLVTQMVAGEPELRPAVEALSNSARAWRERSAEPLAADVAANGPGAPDAVLLVQSKAAFDQVRLDFNAVVAAVEGARSDARADLDAATEQLIVAMAAAGLVLVGAALTLRWTLHRSVLEPLEALGGATRRVSAGELTRPIEPSGPAEVAHLGDDVEAMRLRILAELDQVDEARARLEAQAAELQRSNEELEQFAYVASHDLQEPLRKITGFCQLLQRRYGGQLDERADQYIEFAVDGARRMQDLINDLLEFSRVGRIAREERSVVPAGQLVERAIASLSVVIEESGAVVEVGELPTLQIEPSLGATLFQNLIANGIKFRREGEVPHIRVSSIERTDHHEITVEDDGIGIGPEYAERVFVIFQRLHTKETYGGTGIGLAMCRKIVEHAGGQIWVDPDRALGTAIHLTLPKLEGAPA